MKRLICCIAVSALLYCAGCSQTPEPAPPEANESGVLPADTPLGSGPFKAIMEVDPSLADHTVYRPDDMDALGMEKLPILAWGNGACSADGNSFRYFLTEIASHGYLAIASGPIGPDKAQFPPEIPAAPEGDNPPAKPPVPSNAMMPRTTTAQLIAAVDWAIAENSREGSIYFGKLDTENIAVAGMSCGGVQAIEASDDPRVKTTIVANSGLFPEPSTISGSGKPVPKESLGLMHAPVLYMSGDESDIAYVNANDDFERINHIPVFRAYQKGIGHGGTYHDPDGGTFGKVALAWLDWQLKGDKEASKMFQGDACGLCTDPEWIVSKKSID